jgi:histidine ammonia-lyase
LLGHDLLQASLWMDVRQAQDPQRHFGQATTAAWSAVRKVIPLRTGPDKMSSQSDPIRAAAFVKAVPASTFYAGTNPPAAGSWKTGDSEDR